MGMFSRKDMIRLFGPLLVEQLLAVLVGMADVVMVAAVGETAVSGVALGKDLTSKFIEASEKMSPDTVFAIKNLDNPEILVNFICANFPIQIGRASCRERV